MIRKWLAIGIILLFVGVTIAPAIAQNTEKSQSTSRGNWLYVGGSGPGNYTKIQDAIDNASYGDTVFVYHGIYYSPIYITEAHGGCMALHLIGEDKNTTILTDSGQPPTTSILFIGWVLGVEISGFTIQKSNPISGGIEIKYSHHVIIHDNIIRENSHGIFIDSIWNSSFYHNIITSNDFYGIEIADTVTNCTFSKNIISNNSIGIIINTDGDCVFLNNTVSNNSKGFEIYAHSGKTIIEYNTIRNNEEGIEVNFQYHFTGSIRCNNFIQNKMSVLSFSKNKLSYVIGDLSLLAPHVKWEKNYWDDWKTSLPKPICSWAVIWVGGDKISAMIRIRIFSIINPLNVLGGQKTVGVVLSIRFDWNPAQEPYDISEVN